MFVDVNKIDEMLIRKKHVESHKKVKKKIKFKIFY